MNLKEKGTLVGFHTPRGIASTKIPTGSTQNSLRPTTEHLAGTKWDGGLDGRQMGLEPPTNPRVPARTRATQKQRQ